MVGHKILDLAIMVRIHGGQFEGYSERRAGGGMADTLL